MAQGATMGTLLSLRQVSQALGVSERTVHRLIENEELHPFKMGKSWRFEQSDIDTYIDRLRKASPKKTHSPLQEDEH